MPKTRLKECVTRFLKNFLPASSNTINSRLNQIENAITDTISGGNFDLSTLLQVACWASEVRRLHLKTFPRYKNCNTGKDIVITATGPTLKNYEMLDGAVHIGVNGAYRKKGLKFEYYFVIDYRGEGRTFRLDEICALDCTRFFGRIIKNELAYEMEIPEKYFQVDGVLSFYCMPLPRLPAIYPCIESFPLMDWYSVLFPAINFAFYTNPKRLFLVGCDTDSNSHFDATKGADKLNFEKLVDGYKAVKQYASCFYPDTQVISINPVGLRGLFTDVYTRPYLESNPNVKKELGGDITLLETII